MLFQAGLDRLIESMMVTMRNLSNTHLWPSPYQGHFLPGAIQQSCQKPAFNAHDFAFSSAMVS